MGNRHLCSGEGKVPLNNFRNSCEYCRNLFYSRASLWPTRWYKKLLEEICHLITRTAHVCYR